MFIGDPLPPPNADVINGSHSGDGGGGGAAAGTGTLADEGRNSMSLTWLHLLKISGILILIKIAKLSA